MSKRKMMNLTTMRDGRDKRRRTHRERPWRTKEGEKKTRNAEFSRKPKPDAEPTKRESASNRTGEIGSFEMKRIELLESTPKSRDLQLKRLKEGDSLNLRRRNALTLKSPDSLKTSLKTTPQPKALWQDLKEAPTYLVCKVKATHLEAATMHKRVRSNAHQMQSPAVSTNVISLVT
jgi:hypothetical protein